MNDQPQSPPPPPRAFAQGTGLLLQLVGGALFFSTCFVCLTSGIWDPISERRVITDASALPSRWESLLSNTGKVGFMLLIMSSTVGGLALMVFGLGLQAEKRRAGWAAFIANLLLAVVLLTAAVLLWIGPASFVARIWASLLTLIVLALLGFTVAALRQIIADPPSGELHTVPHDFDPKRHL